MKLKFSKLKVIISILLILSIVISAIFVTNILNASKTSGMRNISSINLAKEMKVGWNLGNTLDATGTTGETSWGNPKTTKAMIDAIKAKGFNTIRIPTTWYTHSGSSPNYTIDTAWMDRVEEVVGYVLDNNMYCILNTHHEGSWCKPTYNDQSVVEDRVTKMWQQISTRFKDYSDYLVFETLNEPRLEGSSTEWTGGTTEYRNVINKLNLAAVNTIRKSGGNNDKRHIMIPTHAAASIKEAMDDLVIPNNDDKIIVSLHMYSPYYFAMDIAGTASWGTSSEISSLNSEFETVYNKFVKNGRAVVVGEWGTINKNNESSRVAHAEAYTKAAYSRGIPTIWWDNGYAEVKKADSYAIFDRNKLTWNCESVANAIIKGVGGNTSTSSTTTVTKTTAPSSTIAPSNTVTSSSSNIYADLNGDGKITSSDSSIVERYVLGVLTLDSTKLFYSDVNLDGKVTSTDVSIIGRYILGLVSSLPLNNTSSSTGDYLFIGRSIPGSTSNSIKFSWSASTIKANFTGTNISANIKSTGDNYFNVIIDNQVKTPINVNTSSPSTILLASGLTSGSHTIEFVKRTEANIGEVEFSGFTISDGKLLTPPTESSKKIEFIGDSITCGYGNEGTDKSQTFTTKNENAYLAYGSLTARQLGADQITVAWSGKGIVSNYGGNTTELLADFYNRVIGTNSKYTWDSTKWTPNVVVLNIGTNDYSATAPDKTVFTSKYASFIKTLRSQYPKAHIYCAIGPMLWGDGLSACRDNIKSVVNSSNDANLHLIEFSQQTGNDGYGEDWHPNLITHNMMATQLVKQIKTDLNW